MRSRILVAGLVSALVVVLAAGLVAGQGSGVGPFEDVGADHRHVVGIQWVKDNGVMQGVDVNKFNPASSMTRAQFATALHNYHQVFHTPPSMSADPVPEVSAPGRPTVNPPPAQPPAPPPTPTTRAPRQSTTTTSTTTTTTTLAPKVELVVTATYSGTFYDKRLRFAIENRPSTEYLVIVNYKLCNITSNDCSSREAHLGHTETGHNFGSGTGYSEAQLTIRDITCHTSGNFTCRIKEVRDSS